jgi:AraC-like DNA-binding protein
VINEQAKSVYLLSQPAAALSAYIENYWFLQTGAQAPFELSVNVFVDARADLIFNFGDPYTRTRIGEPPHSYVDSNLDAQRSYPIKIVQKGAMHVAGVRFRTAGLAPFVTPPVHRWNNRVVPIAEVFGASVLSIEQNLRAAGDDLGAQAQILDAFFLGRLRTTAAQQTLHRLKAEIESEGGLVRIDELCELESIAMRQLARLFRDCMGFSPKTFSRIVRFQNALLLLKGHPGCTLADVAARCGYYDQSHFVRECRTFAGVAPSAQVGYFPAGAPADFSPNLVQFVQDAETRHGESSLRYIKERKK